jgi:HEAT repeats
MLGCVFLTELTDDLTAGELVSMLADAHRCIHAYQRLLGLGDPARQAALDGLAHENAQVREYCCKVLDRLMDTAAVVALLRALDDPAERVRLAAAHALACARCKEGQFGPEARTVLPRGIGLLRGDESAHVRAMAVELVGQWVHTHPAACAAILEAAASDPAPAVRKKASWYAPGGAVYRRTRPRPHRLRPR